MGSPNFSIDATSEDVAFIQKNGFDLVRMAKLPHSDIEAATSEPDFKPLTADEFQKIINATDVGLKLADDPRNAIILKMALTYIKSNLDDVNDSFAPFDEEAAEGKISYGGQVIDPVSEQEIDKLLGVLGDD